jgi:hypothetical protein
MDHISDRPGAKAVSPKSWVYERILYQQHGVKDDM